MSFDSRYSQKMALKNFGSQFEIPATVWQRKNTVN